MIREDCDELPEGWAAATLAEVFHLNPPKPKSADFADETAVSFVPMPAVDAVTGTIQSPTVRTFHEVRKGFTAFRDGDVIFAKITPCMENGKAAVAHELQNGLGFGSTEFHVFRPTGSVIAEYLFHFIRQESFRQRAVSEMTGSVGQKRVPAEYLAQTTLPIPPLLEQRRIVTAIERILARISSARERLERVPDTLKRFRQAVLHAACSGDLTADWRQVRDISYETCSHDEFIEYPDCWTCKKTAELVEPGTVITYGIVLPGPNQAEGVRYIRGMDIDDSGRIHTDQLWRTSPEIAAKHKRAEVREGDVLLCVIRNLRVAIVPAGLDGANLTQGTVRLRPSAEILGQYLAYYLASPQAQQWMKSRYVGSDMPRINVEHTRIIPVPLPSIAEQGEIVERVKALFSLAEAVERRAALAHQRVEKLTQSVLGRAFGGELVPTEAELARREHRSYEPASELLVRLKPSSNGATKRPSLKKPSKRATASDGNLLEFMDG